ncbi:Putative metallopeptidase, catalytic domain superfamily [Septoria linicola]|uniref:Metallopeptidase, catalytic domain superfamily n=1 Tax=Septoria linicola TaxID=215465 RepID=A0A9Q9AYA7_9PEZI|nr:putative metallopeptidase, catalytic domain superfamily [Septoria linicola]USW52856.1 Putative metallopeptidase, catalytic domain superfamily [Septoria linicola]
MGRTPACALFFLAMTATGLPQQATTIDLTDPNKADPVQVPDKNFVLPESCSPEEQEKIKIGFWDAQDLLKYAARWSTDRSSRDVVSADYWIGSDWREYSSRVKSNLENASKFVHKEKSSYITITCQDPKGYCNRGRVERKVIGGYAWDVDGIFWTYGHINMCIDELNYYRSKKEINKLQSMRYYQTYGQFMSHEMMYLKSTYNEEPKIVDVYLQKGDGSMKNDFPGVPGKRETPGDPGLPPPLLVLPSVSFGNSTDLSIDSIDDQLANAIDSYLTTEGGSDADTSDVCPATPDDNACHGINGDYWIMSRDLALDNAKDFCGQADQTKKYNVGSVNELELPARNFKDTKRGPKDARDCLDRFQDAVIDGCDGHDPLNNPHNYKFGSTLTTSDGWELKMTPLSKQVNEVRGKNWPDAELGANGEGLREELSGCGALTKWKFERTPDDCCFHWYASGQLPALTKNCIGRAVMSAGGSGKGNCHGAGKRGTGGIDSIDEWPGYGDNSKHVFREDALLSNITSM